MPDGKGKFISFQTIGYGTNYSTGKPRLSTEDPKLQEAIEASEHYRQGIIKMESSTEVGVTDSGSQGEVVVGTAGVTKAEFPEVTNIREAKVVLTGEPYNVSRNSVAFQNLDKLFAKADQLGISFPNLKVD
jgi:hypothetical protein